MALDPPIIAAIKRSSPVFKDAARAVFLEAHKAGDADEIAATKGYDAAVESLVLGRATDTEKKTITRAIELFGRGAVTIIERANP